MQRNDPYAKSVMKNFLHEYFDKWCWLLSACKNHSIDPFLCDSLTKFLEAVTLFEKEGDPLNLALAFKNGKVTFEQSLIDESFPLSEHWNFSNFKDSVNGHPFCYTLDGGGIIHIGQVPSSLITTTQFLTMRNVSDAYKTITFCLMNRILEANDEGKLVRVKRGGFWMKPCTISFDELVQQGFPIALLESLLKISLQLSTSNKGGIMIATKNNEPTYRTPLIGHVFEKKNINEITDEQLINFLLIDGATIFNTEGQLIGIAQHLEAPYSSDCTFETGRGTKHNSALLYTRAVDCVAFVVSHEGPITIYFGGKIFARCFGEIFGYRVSSL